MNHDEKICKELKLNEYVDDLEHFNIASEEKNLKFKFENILYFASSSTIFYLKKGSGEVENLNYLF